MAKKDTIDEKVDETVETKTTSGTKPSSYVIGCKLPNGLSFKHGDVTVRLAGANSSQLVNGFGLTHDVSAEAWESFEKAFKNQKIFTNGLVFAVGDEKSAKDASLERSKQKTGLEQANPEAVGVKKLEED